MNYIIPTIDVEAIRTLSKLGNFDDLILGKIGNDFFGTTKIAEIIHEYGGHGTFYVDFAEKDHGLDKLKFLSENILKYNSDVQLHIHPQFIADNSRYLLNTYNKNEQKEIISNCVEVYEKCLGEKPISFRAGGYSANDNTMEVLSESDILIDSSYFHNHKWCEISQKPINVISKHEGIYELPITIFNNHISYNLLNVPIKKRTLTKKLDIDACSMEELKKGFDAFNENGIRIIVLFLHSYSFIKWSTDYKVISPDYNDIKKFKFILEYATKQGYKIESVKNISSKLNNYLDDNSTLPKIYTDRNIINSFSTTVNNKYRTLVRGK
jgi:hypothetical protein